MNSTKQRKAITREEIKQLSLLSWRNAHRDATPTELAQAEWRVKKLLRRGWRGQGRVGAIRGNQP